MKTYDVTALGEFGEMLEFANAAASIVTTRKGALRVMPKLEEISHVQRGV